MNKLLKKVITAAGLTAIMVTSTIGSVSAAQSGPPTYPINYLNITSYIVQTSVTQKDTQSSNYMNWFPVFIQQYYPENSVWCGSWDGDVMASGYNAFAATGYDNSYYQCYGFAMMLAQEYYKTSIFMRYNDSTSFVPRVGDSVRINNGTHSIFITMVMGDEVTYVDCNKNGDAKVHWDQKISVAELKQRFTCCERPVKVGDANGDDKIDTQDTDLLGSILRKPSLNDNSCYGNRNTAMDINNDRVLNIADLGSLNQMIKEKTTKNFGYICTEADKTKKYICNLCW